MIKYCLIFTLSWFLIIKNHSDLDLSFQFDSQTRELKTYRHIYRHIEFFFWFSLIKKCH